MIRRRRCLTLAPTVTLFGAVLVSAALNSSFAASSPTVTEQLHWVRAKSSDAVADPAKLDVQGLSLDASPIRKLAAGAWTLVRIEGLGRLRLVGSDLAAANINAVEVLGSKGQGWVEHPLHEVSAGALELRNPSTQARLFMVGAAKRDLELELLVQASVQPDLAWDKASAQLLKGEFSGATPNPQVQAVLAAKQSLLKAYPKQRAAVQAWARWALAKTLLSLRPAAMTGWSKKILEPEGASLGTWSRETLEGQVQDYTRVLGPMTLWVDVQAPGVLDVEFRGLVGSTPNPPSLSVYAQGVLAETLQTSNHEAKVKCKKGAANASCTVPVGSQTVLGQAARTRVALMGKGRSRLRIDVQGGEGLLRLRQARLRPRLGQDPLRRASQDSCGALQGALQGLPKTHPAQVTLGALSAGCVAPSAGSKPAQAAAIDALCDRVEPTAKPLLAKALTKLGQSGARCHEERPAASALGALSSLYSRMITDSEAAWSVRLRSDFMRGYKQDARWIRLSPEQDQVSGQSWIIDDGEPFGAGPEPWQVSRDWRSIAPSEVYRIEVPEQGAAQPQLARLDLAWDQRQGPARVIIDDQPQSIDPARAHASWLLAPGAHRLQIEADPGAKLFATMAPTGTQSSNAARVVKLWPLTAADAPVSFALPAQASALPIRVTLRRIGNENPQAQKTLWLRDDTGTKTRIVLPKRSLEPESALALAGAEPISEPLEFDTKLAAGARRVWIEAESGAADAYRVAFRYRGPTKLATIHKAPASGSQDSDAAPPGAASKNPEIAHGQRLLAQNQWGALRDLLVQWSQSSDAQLQQDRAERLALLESYRSYLRENTGAYKILEQEKLPAVMSANFLSETQKSSVRSASAALLAAAKGVDTPSGKQDAVWAAYRFSDAAQPEVTEQGKLWPLAYGLMNLPGYQIANPRLNALRAKSAKHSRWSSLDFAYKSAGFEHIERSGLSSAHQENPLGSVLEQDKGAFALANGQTRTLSLQADDTFELRLSSFCRAASGGSQAPMISVSLDDAEIQTHPLSSAKVMDLSWSLTPGQHHVTVRGSEQARCVFRLQRKAEQSEGWTTVSMPSTQRWFAAGPKRPLAFHAQGPGVLALQTRALGDASVPAKLLVKRSTEQSSKEQSFGLVSIQDPEFRLSRDPKLAVNVAEQNFVVLPEDKVYLVELSSPARELLVRAKVRVPHEAAPVQLVKRDWAKTLGTALAPTASANAFSPELSIKPVGTRRIFAPASSRVGSFDLALQSGIERDTQFETIQSRVVSGLVGTYRRELSPDRLWFRGQLSAQSQRLAAPMFAAQFQLAGQAKRAPIRARVGAQYGLQPVLGQVPTAGRAWVDLEASLRNAYRKSTPWDLRPSLRFDTRIIGARARELGPQDTEQQLNSSIYRKYAVDHALALKPKLVWTYRDLRNARVDLGSDLWLNADFKGIDRTRAWLRFAGIYRRRSDRPSWWIYQAGYRWTYALVDTHRRNAYMRHALQGQVRFAWQWAKKRRLHLSLADTLIFSDQGFAGNEIRLSLGLRFDPLEAFRHSAPQERRFLGEFAREDWKVVGLR